VTHWSTGKSVRPSIDGAIDKINRASSQRIALNDEIEAFLDHQDDRFIRELQGNGQVHLYRTVDFPDLPSDWPLALGEILHNYRSALSHIAWQLVRLGPGRPGLGTDFPIYDRLKDFSNLRKGGRYVAGMSTDAIEALKTLQPYKARRNSASHPLHTLARLNNIDKHRQLLLFAIATDYVTWDLPPDVPSPSPALYPLESGAPIATFVFASPRPEIDLHAKFSLQVRLRETGLRTTPLFAVLNRIDWYIIFNVANAIQPFFPRDFPPHWTTPAS
jgi:hypothetical protein